MLESNEVNATNEVKSDFSFKKWPNKDVVKQCEFIQREQ